MELFTFSVKMSNREKEKGLKEFIHDAGEYLQDLTEHDGGDTVEALTLKNDINRAASELKKVREETK